MKPLHYGVLTAVTLAAIGAAPTVILPSAVLHSIVAAQIKRKINEIFAKIPATSSPPIWSTGAKFFVDLALLLASGILWWELLLRSGAPLEISQILGGLV